MKVSFALSVIIVGIGLTIGFFHRQRLAELREDRDQLLARAAGLGLDSWPRSVTRQRYERENRGRSAATEIGALARRLQLGMQNDALDVSFRNQAIKILDRMTALEPEQLRLIIADLRSDRALTQATLRNLIGFSIMMLAEENPATALTLFSEAGDLVDDDPLSDELLAASLANLAKDDPRLALKWIRENPELADSARYRFLASTARGDPSLALQMIGELGFDENSHAITAIAEAGETLDQRAAILAALRGHLSGIRGQIKQDQLREEGLGAIARSLSGEGFGPSIAWISSQKLNPVEIADFTGGLTYDITGSETGPWIDWMAQAVPAGLLDKRISGLMGQWTQQDYLAAGQWLTATRSGPARSAAVKSYAETVAEYEPQVAGQWALTLTDAEERAATLERIYRKLPQAEAVVFAAEYGIVTE